MRVLAARPSSVCLVWKWQVLTAQVASVVFLRVTLQLVQQGICHSYEKQVQARLARQEVYLTPGEFCSQKIANSMECCQAP